MAHPDDEMGFASVLAHYAALGVRVRLVALTSGQKGFRSHTDIEAVDELVRVRKEELREASRILGLEPPVFLDFVDQELLGDDQEEVRERLAEVLQEYDFHVVVTFGPDGVTGHRDHRAVSCFVTEILQARDDLRPRLYYHALSPESVEHFRRRTGRTLLGVSGDFLTTRIRVSESEVEKGVRAVGAYRSQFSPDFLDELREIFRKEGRKVHFRRVLPSPPVDGPMEECFFNGA